ncbi:MAG: response regulator [Acidimicrobiales bacterium]
MPRLLIASDSPKVREEVRSVLDPDELQVQEVDGGRSVAPAVAAAPPDLAVLDCQIGSMGAMAICLDLRLEESGGRLPHVPVLMLLDRRADVFLARRSGAEGWIVKPLDPIRLRQAIRCVLGGRNYEDPSYRPVPTLSAAESPQEELAPEQTAAGVAAAGHVRATASPSTPAGARPSGD